MKCWLIQVAAVPDFYNEKDALNRVKDLIIIKSANSLKSEDMSLRFISIFFETSQRPEKYVKRLIFHCLCCW